MHHRIFKTSAGNPTLVALMLGASCLATSFGSSAQTWPSRPVRFIVPSSSGSGADTVGRILAQKVSTQIGQQVVVDPRAGAGGNLAAQITASATPDGYTLLMVAPGHVINTNLNHHLSYDLMRDYVPIEMLTTTSYIIATTMSLPVTKLQDLIALAKAKPGQLNFASAGTGNASQLAGELFNTVAGIKLVHVPYKGAGPATTDLIGGQVQVMFVNLSATLPYVKSHQMRGLAVTGEKRSSAAPDIPTAIESGVPGYIVTSWFGLMAPAKTPQAIVTRLNNEFTAALKAPEVRERLVREGAEPTGGSPADMKAFLQSETSKWGKVIATAKITAD